MRQLLVILLLLASRIILSVQDVQGQPKESATNLVFRTYMTPSIPQGFYELVIDYLNKNTSLLISLSIELEHSGPPKNQPDPFISEEIHIAQMCSPPFIWLDSKKDSPIEFLGLVPLFKDPRIKKDPIYFSDIIVAHNSSIQSIQDLKGKSWCYNDPESLSGYFCMLQHLASIKQTTGFFSKLIQSGGHLQSIQLVAAGKIDASAIDSNGLLNFLKLYPEFNDKIRVIESWGPFPIQPVVVSKNLPQQVKDEIKQALLAMALEKKDELAHFLVEGFGVVTDQDYDHERQLLAGCKHLLNEGEKNE